MSEACCHPQTRFVKVMFFTRVCHSVHAGGDLPHCMLGYTPTPSPPDQRPKPPPRTRGRYTPWGRHPPGSEAGVPPGTRGRYPPEQTPPPPPRPEAGTPPWTRGRYPLLQCMLGDTGNKRAVRILLECNLVFATYLMWQTSNLIFCQVERFQE